MIIKQKNQGHQLYIVFLFLGIVLGSITCGFLLQKNHGFIVDFMMSREQINFSEMKHRALFLYLVKNRVLCLTIFLLLAMLFSFPKAFLVSLFCWGGYYGFFVSLILYYKNIEMVPRTLLCFFPHWIFYYLGILSIVNFFQSRNTYCSLNQPYLKNQKCKYFLKIFVIFICFVIGLFFEFYSQNFLKEIFTNM